jgi:hypothetical protein
MPDTSPVKLNAGTWEGHWEEQVLWIARNTTPAERFRWLEETIEMLRPQLPELLRNRQLLVDLDARQAQKNSDKTG